MSEKKERVLLRCSWCQSPVLRRKEKIKNSYNIDLPFCNRECRTFYFSDKSTVTRTCVICNRPFKTSRLHSTQSCDRSKCRYTIFGNNSRGHYSKPNRKQLRYLFAKSHDIGSKPKTTSKNTYHKKPAFLSKREEEDTSGI